MTTSRRMQILLLILAVIGVLIARDHFVRPSRKTVVAPSVRSGSTGKPQETSVVQDPVMALRARDDYRQEGTDAFSNPARSKQAAVPITDLPPPPKPVAPAMPFTVIGKKLQGGTWEVYLASQEDVFIVHEGDSIKDAYKVLSIKPPEMQIVYLPLNENQTVAIGASYDE